MSNARDTETSVPAVVRVLLNEVFCTFYSISLLYYCLRSGFGGLVVSVLGSGTRGRGFKPGRSRRIFRAKKSSARLPSEGK